MPPTNPVAITWLSLVVNPLPSNDEPQTLRILPCLTYLTPKKIICTIVQTLRRHVPLHFYLIRGNIIESYESCQYIHLLSGKYYWANNGRTIGTSSSSSADRRFPQGSPRFANQTGLAPSASNAFRELNQGVAPSC